MEGGSLEKDGGVWGLRGEPVFRIPLLMDQSSSFFIFFLGSAGLQLLYYSEMTTSEEGRLRRRTPARIHVPNGEVRVLESHHASGFAMESGAWPFHKICWVAVGRGTLDLSGNEIPIRQDDFLLLPARKAHRFVDQHGDPLTLVIVCISEAYFSGELSGLWEKALLLGPEGAPLCARNAFHHYNLVECFRLALHEQSQKRTGWGTALKTRANELLLQLARKSVEARQAHVESSLKTVMGAIEYLHSHLNEPLLIRDFAERCNLSSRRFTTLFKQCTGQTFSQYLNTRRIAYACERLAETGHIAYACYESGFNDLAYFYRVFRKHRGQTPGEYLAGQKNWTTAAAE